MKPNGNRIHGHGRRVDAWRERERESGAIERMR